MRILLCYFAISALLLQLGAVAALGAEDQGQVARWSFDRHTDDALVNEDVSPQAEMQGFAEFTKGVKGDCLVLDGVTTVVDGVKQPAVNLGNEFTLTAWVALGCYPLNKAPVVELGASDSPKLELAIDAKGRAVVGLQTADGWMELKSKTALALRQWHRLAAVLGADQVLRLYVDGQPIANQKISAASSAVSLVTPLIGRSRIKQKPEGTIRPEGTGEVYDYLDGALDEITLLDRPLTDQEIADAYQSASPLPESPLPPRVLPSGPAGPGPFGAFYTHLKFYPQWDRPWRVGAQADVVVRFEDLPGRFIFWRGTSYIPHWVTENGIWFNNEFTETWEGVQGCGEPMSDKQCRFSHVRVLESNAARAVVHWRYALVDVFYKHARVDPDSGWGDWTDEIYTIYPDGTSVREVTLHSTAPNSRMSGKKALWSWGRGLVRNSRWSPTR